MMRVFDVRPDGAAYLVTFENEQGARTTARYDRTEPDLAKRLLMPDAEGKMPIVNGYNSMLGQAEKAVRDFLRRTIL